MQEVKMSWASPLDDKTVLLKTWNTLGDWGRPPDRTYKIHLIKDECIHGVIYNAKEFVMRNLRKFEIVI